MNTAHWLLLAPPVYQRGGANSLNNDNDFLKYHCRSDDPIYFFLGASAGFSGAGAGVAAGAAGAGASAGFTSSLAAGFGASFALHPIPITAKLITKTIASKRKIHFFMCIHLLSDWNGNPPLFYPMKASWLHWEKKSLGSPSSIISVQQAF